MGKTNVLIPEGKSEIKNFYLQNHENSKIQVNFTRNPASKLANRPRGSNRFCVQNEST